MAVVRITAEPVVVVIHHTRAKETRLLPRRENAWPIQTTKNSSSSFAEGLMNLERMSFEEHFDLLPVLIICNIDDLTQCASFNELHDLFCVQPLYLR